MATVYVSPSGSNSYTYVQAQSSSTPWLTFSKVNTSATTGDTVSVAAGTYTFASITWTKSFTIVGADATTTLVDGAGAAVSWVLNPNQSLTMSNLTFKNALTEGASLRSLFDFGNSAATEATTFSLTSCIIRDITIVTNTFLRSALFGTSGNNSQEFSSAILTNCLIYNVSQNNATYAHGMLWATPGVMSNCVFTLNQCTIITGQGTYPNGSLIYGAGGGATNTLTIKNTIIYNTTGTVNLFKSATEQSMFGTENATYSDFYSLTTTGLTLGTGIITSDPLFVDLSTNNYKLRPSSPCIDTGTTS